MKYTTADSIMIALPKTFFEPHKIVHLRFEIAQDNTIIQMLPGFGALEVKLNEDYADSWFI